MLELTASEEARNCARYPEAPCKHDSEATGVPRTGYQPQRSRAVFAEIDGRLPRR